MNLMKFTVFSFLGSLPWTALLVFAGVQLGANWETVGAWLKRFEYAILAILVRDRRRLDLAADHQAAPGARRTSRRAAAPRAA